MKRKQRTARRTVPADIEQLLRSLDGIERARPRPFFATRAEARLDRLQALPQPLSWAFRPAALSLSLGLLLLLNVSAVVLYRQYLLPAVPAAASTDRFAADWQLTEPLNW